MQTGNNIEQTHLKNNPFRVPQGYFDLLPQQVGQKIAQMSVQEVFDDRSGFSIRKIVRPQLALAASFALMIGLGYGIVRLVTPDFVEVESSNTEHISLFRTYTLLQNDEWEEAFDSEQIIAFLTEQGISPYAIASLD